MLNSNHTGKCTMLKIKWSYKVLRPVKKKKNGKPVEMNFNVGKKGCFAVL